MNGPEFASKPTLPPAANYGGGTPQGMPSSPAEQTARFLSDAAALGREYFSASRPTAMSTTNGGHSKGAVKADAVAQSSPANGSGTAQQPPTQDMIIRWWRTLLRTDKKGIAHFYGPGHDFLAEAARAADMAAKVMKNGCTKEVAIQLSLLALYDVVLLVDNSLTMELEDEGARISTLKATLKSIAAVYRLVSEIDGIISVRFLNSNKWFSRVTPGSVDSIVEKAGFRGMTKIGTELRERILKNYATVSSMKRPLLVVVLTDGEIEGEPKWLLRDVLKSKALELHRKWGNEGPQAVAYQFAMIGQDQNAIDLLKSLDDDKELGDYIDCMPSGSLEAMRDPAEKWNILPKLLLGALLGDWDKQTISDEHQSQTEFDEVLERDQTDSEDEGEECSDSGASDPLDI